MVDPFQTLRFRLTGQYVVIFGLLQFFLWATVYFIVNEHLRQRFDSELLRRAQTIAAGVKAESPERPEETAFARAGRFVNAFESEQFYILVELEGPNPAIRSANAEGLTFPAALEATKSVQPRFSTLEGAGTTSAGEPIRIVALRGDVHSIVRSVQVGASLGPVERVMLDIQRLLVVFVAMSLFLAGISSWVVAGRTLRPIGVIAREASTLTAAQLSQRITVPRHNDEVAEMVVALNGMLSRLQTQFKNAYDFISNASHELKTPLAVMLGHVQNVGRTQGISVELRGFLDSAEEELWRMLKIVDSSLILTRARNAERMRMTTPVEIEETVISAIRATRHEATKKGIHVVPRFSASDEMLEGPIVLGDADLLSTMFENLIGNAIRYTPAGGAVEVEVKTGVKEIEASVRDRGPGIAEQHLLRIFEMCYQVDPNSDTAGKSGIGLTIVQAVAELHGGVVDVKNPDGGGCIFTVRLPRANI